MSGRLINWLNYAYIKQDGYGRYGMAMIRALLAEGLDVRPGVTEHVKALPPWMHLAAGWDWSRLTVQCLPVFSSIPLPGRSWILSMTENTGIPKEWPDMVNANAERLIVPCEHNREVFAARGVRCPIHVVPGGTDPVEFPVLPRPVGRQPYTFLALSDRQPRKGHETVWDAFHMAFGDAQQTPDVRLLIKGRRNNIHWLNSFNFTDRRISFWRTDVDSMSEIYSIIDCYVNPSYGDGWGMTPREAAMMGKRVIATKWSGLEDGVDNWAIPLTQFKMGPALPEEYNGEWAVPDVEEVAAHMRWCYDNQEQAQADGLKAAQWLRDNQTWAHSAKALISLMEKHAL